MEPRTRYRWGWVAAAGIAVSATGFAVSLAALGADVGSFGEWIGGLGALAAVAAALVTFRWQRASDIAAREKEARDAAVEAGRRDLDEARRIVYTAMLAFDSREPLPVDVRAALANILTHHTGHLGASDAVNLVNELHWYTTKRSSEPTEGLRREFQNLARNLSDELGEDAAVWDLPPGATRPIRHPDDPEQPA